MGMARTNAEFRWTPKMKLAGVDELDGVNLGVVFMQTDDLEVVIILTERQGQLWKKNISSVKVNQIWWLTGWVEASDRTPADAEGALPFDQQSIAENYISRRSL